MAGASYTFWLTAARNSKAYNRNVCTGIAL